jgi:hypothetical protein
VAEGGELDAAVVDRRLTDGMEDTVGYVGRTRGLQKMAAAHVGYYQRNPRRA